MEKAELTAEQEELAKKVSDQIGEILTENKMLIGTEMIYSPSGISAKPIIIFAEPDFVETEKND